MNAAIPLQQQDSALDHRAAERRAHEPSMEEILASIRRIIADDQAFPSGRAAPTVEAVQAPPQAAPQPAPHVFSPKADPAPREEAPRPIADVERIAAPTSYAANAGASFALAASRAAPVGPVRGPSREEPAPASVPQMERPIAAAEASEPEATTALLRGSSDPLAESSRAKAPHSEQSPSSQMTSTQAIAAQPAADSVPSQQVQTGGEILVGENETPLVSAATDAAVGSAFNALVTSHFLQNAGVLADLAREMLRPMLKAWLDDNLPIMVERLVRSEIERVARGGR